MYIHSNPFVKDVLDEMIDRVRNYLGKNSMDERNLSLFMIFIVLNTIIIPQCSRICRYLLFEQDLSYKFMFLTKDWLDPSFQVEHLETQLRSLAVYHELLDVFNSIFPSLLIHMFNSEMAQSVDNLIEMVSDSYHIYRGQTASSTNRDTGINKVEISPYLDKVSLIPIKDFIDLYSLFKDISKWSHTVWNKVVSYPNTVSLL